jgi:CubicO group peptidase (beta-lactamase class C family)
MTGAIGYLVYGQTITPGKPFWPEALAERLDAVLPALLRSAGVPDLAVSLVDDGQVAWAKGFGVRSVDGGLPVDTETLFEAASLSKPAFAYAVLQLVGSGKLDFDAPLANYLAVPWISNESRLKRITARMVLSHTSGLPHGWPRCVSIREPNSPTLRTEWSISGRLWRS